MDRQRMSDESSRKSVRQRDAELRREQVRRLWKLGQTDKEIGRVIRAGDETVAKLRKELGLEPGNRQRDR